MDKKSRELVMGKLYFKNKDYKMAEKSFNEYLNVNPEDVNALKLMAQVHEQNKRFDKAFEMYERCYLAEPDRTGVLLDICRILLMNEIWLEHVDYRKWLNLAIKAFPSNSIVVNFKALLSTLAPEDRPIQSKETTNSLTSARDDTLAKVLDKLCLLEEKLDKIEQRLDSVRLSKEVDAPEKPVSSSIPQSQSLKTSSVLAPSLVQPFTPQPVSDLAPKLPTTSTQNKPVVPPSPASQTPFLFTPSSLTPTQNNSSTIQTTASHSLQTSAAPLSFTTNLFQDSINRLNIQNKPLQTSPFSGNLFAQSISKLNLPTSSSSSLFSFPSTFPSATKQITSNNVTGEKDNDGDTGDGDGNELVPNEELTIENTCDMNPIEIKTGEEDENPVFEHRCKLFRFKEGEYKERGLGSIKVLKHKTTFKGRLIMRREVVGLVCLNCWDLSKIERMRETQVRFGAVDASDGEAVMSVFLVKFKTKDITDSFISHLNALFSEDSNTLTNSIQADPTSNNTERPEIELVNPKLDQSLVDKARELKLPDLFYHKLKNQDECSGCIGCETDG